MPAPAQILQQHCLETNKDLQWAQPVPGLLPLPWLCLAMGSMFGVHCEPLATLPVLTLGPVGWQRGCAWRRQPHEPLGFIAA